MFFYLEMIVIDDANNHDNCWDPVLKISKEAVKESGYGTEMIMGYFWPDDVLKKKGKDNEFPDSQYSVMDHRGKAYKGVLLDETHGIGVAGVIVVTSRMLASLRKKGTLADNSMDANDYNNVWDVCEKRMRFSIGHGEQGRLSLHQVAKSLEGHDSDSDEASLTNCSTFC